MDSREGDCKTQYDMATKFSCKHASVSFVQSLLLAFHSTSLLPIVFHISIMIELGSITHSMQAPASSRGPHCCATLGFTRSVTYDMCRLSVNFATYLFIRLGEKSWMALLKFECANT